MDETALAIQAARGDREAFERLVVDSRQAVYGWCYRVLLNEEDALDATQQTFLRLSERLGSYSGRGAFRSWLRTVAVREAITLVRKDARREDAYEPERLEIIAGAAAGCVREKIEREQRLRLIQGAMSELSPQQRAILLLRVEEDLKPREIAERLDLESGHVRSQLCRALARLREVLGQEEAP